MDNRKKSVLLEDDFRKILKANPEWIINPHMQEKFDKTILPGELIEVTFEDFGIEKLVENIVVVDENFIEESLKPKPNGIKVKILKKTQDAVIPTVAYNGTSACFDITATETKIIPAKGSAMVENGLFIEVPYGYYMQLECRSGLAIKHDLQVHQGVIDTGYTGPLGVKIFNHGDKDVTINKGDRYVQAGFHKVTPIQFEEINEEQFKQLEENSLRGKNGWGSSGK